MEEKRRAVGDEQEGKDQSEQSRRSAFHASEGVVDGQPSYLDQSALYAACARLPR